MADRNEEPTPETNEVRLVGQVSGEPAVRTLPSGDELAVARIVVPRDRVRLRPDGRRGQSVDVVECAAWDARPRGSIGRWREGDTVAVEGALRKRFFRSGGGTASRVEVEVRTCRVVRRSPAG